MFNTNFFECHDVALGFRPVDMSTGANNGSWVNMAGFDGCAVLLVKTVGTAGDDPTFTLQQAKSNSGEDAKDLDFTRVYEKTGTTGTSVTGGYTVHDQASGNTYTSGTLAENAGVVGVWVSVEDMDTQNGFNYIRGAVPDVGTNTGQLGALVYIGTGAKYKGPEMPYL